MFLVTAFMGGQVIETLASRQQVQDRLGWVEGDHPILECESIDTPAGRVAVTMTIRRATKEEKERLTNVL